MGDRAIDPSLLRALEAAGDYRLLRRLEVREGWTDGRELPEEGTSVGAALDVETTGVGEDDRIVELAIRRFRYDGDCRIVRVDRAYSWLEDPGFELPEDVAKLTGLTDTDLAGHVIDDDAVARVLAPVDFVVAHNARFDRPRVERRLPDVAGRAWACSLRDVNWRGLGFEGGALGHLLSQCGLFHDGHRAVADVDATIALLGHVLPDGGTVLARMLRSAAAPSWRIRAVGAAYEVKDLLKGRGYRWDGERREWWREVADRERDPEEWWLAGQVYDLARRPRCLGPIIERVTWRERHA